MGMSERSRSALTMSTGRTACLGGLGLVALLVLFRTTGQLPRAVEAAVTGVSLDAAVAMLCLLGAHFARLRRARRTTIVAIASAGVLAAIGMIGRAVFPVELESHSVSVDLAVIAAAASLV